MDRDLDPCIVFSFSKKDCETYALQMARLDFNSADHSMRLVSVHPGVSVADVQAATSFELVIDGDVGETREPTADEQAVIDRLDPRGLRHREVS